MEVNEAKLRQIWQKYITDHQFNPEDIRVEVQFKYLLDIIKKYKKGSVVLDIGAGDKVLEPLFTGMHYISLDSQAGNYDYSKLDIVGDVLNLPIANESIDIGLLVWVLEHVKEPYLALKEIYRILKPGGVLYLLAPLFLHEHMQPHDYYRYTQYGLKYLLEKANFKNILIKPSSGTFTSLAHISLFGILNFLRLLDIYEQNKIITFEPNSKNLLTQAAQIMASFQNAGFTIDKAYLNNNVDFLPTNLPADYIVIAYKDGDLIESNYNTKEEVLKNILACPKCYKLLPDEYFTSKLESYKCFNCNNEFKKANNIWNFINENIN